MFFTDRTELLIGKNGIEKLKNSNIMLVGVGGVGGYTAEMLVRSGIGKITLMDFDTISISNINRQIIALHSNVGNFKTTELKNRLLDINPNCNITTINERITKNNLNLLNNGYNIIIDAIDSVDDKVEMIKYCIYNNIPIISALGAGNRIGIPKFEVCDIYETYNDGLAKKIRKLLRENKLSKHLCVSTKDTPIKNTSTEIGSICYYPAMCGCVLSAYVINEIIKE